MSRHRLFKPFTNLDDLQTAINKGKQLFYRDTLDLHPRLTFPEIIMSQSFQNVSFMIYNKNLGIMRISRHNPERFFAKAGGITKRISPEELLIMLAVHSRTTVKEVHPDSKSSINVGVRGVFAFLAYYSLEKTITTTASYLNRDRTTVSKSKKVIEQYLDTYDHSNFRLLQIIKFINKYHTLFKENGITTDKHFIAALQAREDWEDSELGYRSFFDPIKVNDN